MQPEERYWTDERIERIISVLLRIGVVGAAALVLTGGVLYLFQYGMTVSHYQVFQGEPLRLCTLGGIIATALTFESSGIIQLGLLLLILTPIARVVFCVVAFGIQRDRLYVSVTLIVLVVLLYDLLLG
ncbi:MAG: DUF1634 domain-containing protein [Syntrophales bacterium]|jgi:uncharacterized membrane protein